MEIVSVTQVDLIDSASFAVALCFSIPAILLFSSAVGWRKMRALKSPAISDLASKPKVLLKLSLNPRTPTSAATPTATLNTTKPNLPGADFKSRQPIAPARFQLNARLAMESNPRTSHRRIRRRSGIRQRVLHHHSVPQHNFAIRPARHFLVVRHQHQRRPRRLFRPAARSSTNLPFAESKFPVGSSAITIGGSTTNARASATRCCSPPESCTG
jgi:hypothetical protein